MFSSSGLRIGRVLGIDIYIHASWALILALFTISLEIEFSGAKGANGKSFPGGVWPWIIGLLTTLFLFFTLLAHELAHSFVAKRNGVQISRITLFLFGGVAEMREDVDSASAEFKMAIAGPMVTLFFAALFYFLYLLADHSGAGPVLLEPLSSIFWFSLFIGSFNLLPGFPLDGGRVLRSILWWRTGDLEKATRFASRAGQAVGLILCVCGGLLLIFSQSWFAGMWLILIGIFIFRLAKASYSQTLMGLAASTTQVGSIMFTQIPVVKGETPLSALKDYYFANWRLPALPVEDEAGKITGIVTFEDLTKISPIEWRIVTTDRISKPISAFTVVSPDTSLKEVLKPLLKDVTFMLVAKEGELLGMLTREELMRFLEVKMKLLRGK